MPKASDIPSPSRGPVSVEALKRAQGLDPYDTTDNRKPVAVPLSGEIEQFPAPSRFPAPEVTVEALGRGVEDRGFSFGRGAQWGTTWARAEELAGQTKIIAIITPKPDADATADDHA